MSFSLSSRTQYSWQFSWLHRKFWFQHVYLPQSFSSTSACREVSIISTLFGISHQFLQISQVESPNREFDPFPRFCQVVKSHIPRKCSQVNEVLLTYFYMLTLLIQHPRYPKPWIVPLMTDYVLVEHLISTESVSLIVSCSIFHSFMFIFPLQGPTYNVKTKQLNKLKQQQLWL